MQDGEEIDVEKAMKVREFMLIFYGTASCPGTQRVAEAINTLILQFNLGNGEYESPRRIVDTLYVSNDESAEEMEEFIYD